MTTKRPYFHRSMAILPCLAVSLLLLFPAAHAHAQRRSSFRNFQNLSVPTPDQLLRKLSELQGIDIPTSDLENLRKFGEQFLEGLSDEEKQFMRQFAENLAQQNGQEIPPHFQELAENFQQQLSGREQPLNLPELLKELPGNLNQQGPSKRSSPIREPRSENRNNNGRIGSGSRENPDSSNPLVPERLRNRSGDQPSSSNPPQTRSSDRPESDPFESMPTPNQEQLERLADRFGESLEEMQQTIPESRAFEPDPDMFQPGLNVPEEPIGNQFDRMIMRAIEKQMEGDAGDTGSQIANSVNNMFGGLVDRIHNRMNERIRMERGRGFGSRTGTNSRSGGGWQPFRGGAPSLGDLGSGLGGMASAGGLSGGMIAGLLALISIGVLIILAFRSRRSESGSIQSFWPGRRYRLPTIQTSEEMVRALDRFLLARFGKPSSWWHSRRAELALNSLVPSMQGEIGKLVDCYEFARYSEVGDSLSASEVRQCVSILQSLVAFKQEPASDSKEKAQVDES